MCGRVKGGQEFLLFLSLVPLLHKVIGNDLEETAVAALWRGTRKRKSLFLFFLLSLSLSPD
jgi:hypothetical protein